MSKEICALFRITKLNPNWVIYKLQGKGNLIIVCGS
jgi:hypothetical protein